MRAWCFVLLATAGCYSPSAPTGAPCADNSACPSGQTCVDGFCGGRGSADGIDADTTDMAIDAPLCTTWTAEHVMPCSLVASGGDLTLTAADSPYDLDTDLGELRTTAGVIVPIATQVLTQTDGPDVLVLSVDHLTLETSSRVDGHGGRPVLFAVWDTASIDGRIDVSANFNTRGPSGSLNVTTLCPAAPTGDSGTTGSPSTGGGGGAFQGDGGRGGNAASGAGTALPVPTVIRGGCSGGLGGANAALTNATRGAGGGAVEIAARTSISVGANGSIKAGGGAGRAGAASFGGGGGGGSGGYIGLDAPSVTIAGIVAANGGAGGGGASDVGAGTNGENGHTGDNAAVGGPGAATSNVGACIKGGNGSGGTTLGGANAAASPCGGGGGGGAAGYVLVWSPALSVTGTVSPPFTAGP